LKAAPEGEKVEQMVQDAISTLDAAEETLTGEVIDPVPGWIEACKAQFAGMGTEEKTTAVTLLREAGYLPEKKMTAKEMFAVLADTLGPRCTELDLVLGELA
jgi:hypothetical protein